MVVGPTGENGRHVLSRAAQACALEHVSVTGHALCLAEETVKGQQRMFRNAMLSYTVQVRSFILLLKKIMNEMMMFSSGLMARQLRQNGITWFGIEL